MKRSFTHLEVLGLLPCDCSSSLSPAKSASLEQCLSCTHTQMNKTHIYSYQGSQGHYCQFREEESCLQVCNEG